MLHHHQAAHQTTPFMMFLPLTLPPHPQSLYSLSTLGYCNGTAKLQLGSTTVTTRPPTLCDYRIIPFDTPFPYSFSILISYPPTPGYCTGTAQLLPIGQKRSPPLPLSYYSVMVQTTPPYIFTISDTSNIQNKSTLKLYTPSLTYTLSQDDFSQGAVNVFTFFDPSGWAFFNFGIFGPQK